MLDFLLHVATSAREARCFNGLHGCSRLLALLEMADWAKVTNRKLALSKSRCYIDVDYFIAGCVLGVTGWSVV